MILGSIVAALTFVAMEGVAWFSHRFLMHGPLWFLHASHHQPGRGPEYNDLFGLFFSILAAALIITGAQGLPLAMPVGLGMTGYGIGYLLLHDTLVHRRFGWVHRPNNAYLRRLIRAHLLHHASNGDRGTYSFLWAPARFARAPKS